MLSRFFLQRPVFAWVIAIILMVAGGLAIHTLPISQYPPIAPPSIAITAFYPGGSAETVENSVTQIIEQKMTGFDKMLYLSATSDSSGSSRVELTFAPGTDPALANAPINKYYCNLMNALGVKAGVDGFPAAAGNAEVSKFGMYDKTEDFIGGGSNPPTIHSPGEFDALKANV